jgi:hypothetical protein
MILTIFESVAGWVIEPKLSPSLLITNYSTMKNLHLSMFEKKKKKNSDKQIEQAKSSNQLQKKLHVTNSG